MKNIPSMSLTSISLDISKVGMIQHAMLARGAQALTVVSGPDTHSNISLVFSRVDDPEQMEKRRFMLMQVGDYIMIEDGPDSAFNYSFIGECNGYLAFEVSTMQQGMRYEDCVSKHGISYVGRKYNV